MSFEVVTTTSLRFKEPLDAAHTVTIVLSEGRWRHLRCRMLRWNHTHQTRLALVEWKTPVYQALAQLERTIAMRGVEPVPMDFEAWVGPVNPALEVGMPAPRIRLIRKFTLDSRTIDLPGHITEFGSRAMPAPKSQRIARSFGAGGLLIWYN